MSSTSYAEAIIGWRLWQVIESEPSSYRLAAWSTDRLVWPPLVRAEGHCLLGGRGHAVPDRCCGCGLYAFRTRELAEWALAAEMRPVPRVLGQVSLWGLVVEHRNGWRAQFGYPYDLRLLAGDEAIARELRATYAVDVEVLDASHLLQRVRREQRRLFWARMAAAEAAG